jgi:hypothetical protein
MHQTFYRVPVLNVYLTVEITDDVSRAVATRHSTDTEASGFHYRHSAVEGVLRRSRSYVVSAFTRKIVRQ